MIALIEKNVGLRENIAQVPVLGFRKSLLENSGVKWSYEMRSWSEKVGKKVFKARGRLWVNPRGERVSPLRKQKEFNMSRNRHQDIKQSSRDNAKEVRRHLKIY